MEGIVGKRCGPCALNATNGGPCREEAKRAYAACENWKGNPWTLTAILIEQWPSSSSGRAGMSTIRLTPAERRASGFQTLLSDAEHQRAYPRPGKGDLQEGLLAEVRCAEYGLALKPRGLRHRRELRGQQGETNVGCDDRLERHGYGAHRIS